MKFLKWQYLVIFSLVLVLAACGGETETNEGEVYNKEDFELTFPSALGEEVSLVPNGKTLYIYFTGIG